MKGAAENYREGKRTKTGSKERDQTNKEKIIKIRV